MSRILELKKLKYIKKDLVHCGYFLKEFKQAGYSIDDLIFHGFNKKTFEKDGFRILIDAGYTFEEITGYIDKEIKKKE